MYHPVPERAADAAGIEALLDLAFGPDRQRKVSYRFREGVPPVAGLRFVVRAPAEDTTAKAEGRDLLGTIRYWPIRVEQPSGVSTPALLLGPIAVRPELQGAGVGRALMFHSLERAAARGHGIILLVGALDYYGRFGFVPAAPHGFTMPDEQPHRLLVRENLPGALAGVSGTLVPARTALPPRMDAPEFSVTRRASLC